MQETECGVAALAIVLAHHGAWVPFPELRKKCEVSAHGVTALALVQAAAQYGLTLRGMRLDADALRLVQAPVILSWEQWHFVVLEGIRGDVAYVNDPARGHRKLSLESLRRGYAGIALLPKPGPAFRPIGHQRQPVRTTLKFLRPARVPLSLFAATSLAESLLLPLTISIAGRALGAEEARRVAHVRQAALLFGGLVAAKTARHWLSGVASSEITRASSIGAPYHREEPADQLATEVMQVVHSGIRMTASLPMLLLILARLHPAAAVIALPALTAPVLRQQRYGRFSTLGSSMPTRHQYVTATVRSTALAAPALVVGMVRTSGRIPSMVIGLGTSWIAFRLVQSAATSVSTLYHIPESIISLSSGSEIECSIGETQRCRVSLTERTHLQ